AARSRLASHGDLAPVRPLVHDAPQGERHELGAVPLPVDEAPVLGGREEGVDGDRHAPLLTRSLRSGSNASRIRSHSPWVRSSSFERRVSNTPAAHGRSTTYRRAKSAAALLLTLKKSPSLLSWAFQRM